MLLGRVGPPRSSPGPKVIQGNRCCRCHVQRVDRRIDRNRAINVTANADKDFISVEQQTMAFASDGDSTLLYVPLVNDNQPEAPESFFVSFGLRNSQHGQLERVATVRVDIIDDDLP